MINVLGCQILNDSKGFHSKWQTLDDFKFFSFMFVFSFCFSFLFFFLLFFLCFCICLNCFSLLINLFFSCFSFSYCFLFLFLFPFLFLFLFIFIFSFPFPLYLYLSFSPFGWCCLVSSCSVLLLLVFGWCCVSLSFCVVLLGPPPPFGGGDFWSQSAVLMRVRVVTENK